VHAAYVFVIAAVTKASTLPPGHTAAPPFWREEIAPCWKLKRANRETLAHRRLSDYPDWGYLLREYYEAYRFLSSGGSDRIRAHQRAVREAISRVIKSNAELRFDAPAHKPVTAHLKRALDEGRLERTATLIRSIESVQDQLTWQYGYEKVPRGLDKKYAYAELCGPNGPILTTEVILGLVLFAPNCTYPAHSHRRHFGKLHLPFRRRF
jgi:dimethylpropiothetin dethiomethylase